MSTIYCTYLTIYSGNKLPPFYIGYSSIDSISEGYHGSVSSREYQSIWKSELRQHPDSFKTIILTKHNNREEANNREILFQKQLKILEKSSIYINRTISTHSSNCFKRGYIPWNKGLTKEDPRVKLQAENGRKARIGRPTWNKGKKCPQISLSKKGISNLKNRGRTRPDLSEYNRIRASQPDYQSPNKGKFKS
jgi:hypothetical protein